MLGSSPRPARGARGDLENNSHANGQAVRTDVKHLVLFLLACKEIMRLEGGKRGAKVYNNGSPLVARSNGVYVRLCQIHISE